MPTVVRVDSEVSLTPALTAPVEEVHTFWGGESRTGGFATALDGWLRVGALTAVG